MIQGSIVSLRLQVAKGHVAVLPGINSDPGNHQRGHGSATDSTSGCGRPPPWQCTGSPTWVQNLEKRPLVLTVSPVRAHRDSLWHTQKLKAELHFGSNCNLQHLPPPTSHLQIKREAWSLHVPRTVEREAVFHHPGAQISLQVHSQPSHYHRALHTAGVIYLTDTFPTAIRSGKVTLPSSLGQNFLSSYHSATSSMPEDRPV